MTNRAQPPAVVAATVALALVLALAPLRAAHASPTLVFYESFDAYETSLFSGVDGWCSGFTSDPWSTVGDDHVYATSGATGGG